VIEPSSKNELASSLTSSNSKSLPGITISRLQSGAEAPIQTKASTESHELITPQPDAAERMKKEKKKPSTYAKRRRPVVVADCLDGRRFDHNQEEQQRKQNWKSEHHRYHRYMKP